MTVEATDETSKLSEKAYSFDNGETWQEGKTKSYNSNTKINSGTIKIKDVCGNIATYNQDIEITNIDKLNPVKPIIEGVTGEEWQNHEVTLTVIAEDTESNSDYTQSGIDFFEYSIDGGNTFTKVDWNESHQFTIVENGDYKDKIVVKVTDKASNTSELSNFYMVDL